MCIRDRIKVENHEAKESSSFGIKKLLVASLKMAIAGILSDIREEEPIMLIDEMLGGLDSVNSGSLADFLGKAKQVFITTADRDFKNDKNYSKFIIDKKNGTPFISECPEKIYTF